jgi:putative membrane protein
VDPSLALLIPPPAHVELELVPLELLPLLIPAALYARRARTLSARGRPVPRWRAFSFAAGLVGIAVALVGLGPLSDEFLFAHMIEHLAIGDLAAVLLVLGLTGPLLQPLLTTRPIDRLRILAHPAIALPLWAVNLYLWHVPALYEATLRSDPLHLLEHVLFVFCGCLVWMPVVGPLPVSERWNDSWRLAYTVAVRTVGEALGLFLLVVGTVLYPVYGSSELLHGISPLTDQALAGVIMIGEGLFVTLAVISWLFLRASREADELQGLLDIAEAQGLDVDRARLERAVRSGQGPHLAERLLHGDRGGEDPGSPNAGQDG